MFPATEKRVLLALEIQRIATIGIFLMLLKLVKAMGMWVNS
ncbi:hypothetical protein HanPSC8_Chr05g0217061 [Helianthus annuus]|nr:hypothetical protein HanPSC8_Chr05g0217061 [Helianthus annuus]